MKRYLRALEQASAVETKAGLSWIVRLLVQGHIRTKLVMLSSIYVQLGQSIDPSDETGYRSWVTKTADDLQLYASSLSAVRLSRLLRVVPTVVAGAGAIGTALSELSKTAAVPEAADIVPIAYATVLAIVATVLWRGSFLAKREIFLENVVYGEGSCPPTAYSAEDELFTVLRRKKPPESLLDIMLESVPIAVFAFILLIDPLRWTKGVTFWTQIAPVMVAALYFCWWWPARANARTTARPR